MGMVNTRLEVNQTVPITFGGKSTFCTGCFVMILQSTSVIELRVSSPYQADIDVPV